MLGKLKWSALPFSLFAPWVGCFPDLLSPLPGLAGFVPPTSLDQTRARRDDLWFCRSAVSVDHHGGQRGRERHGRNRTACGPPLRDHGLTAAHKSLPCGTRIRVTNKGNGRSTIVTITDRGPFVRGRVIDLSIGAAQALGFHGLARVSLGRI